MKTVSLTNTTKRMAVFVLTHDEYCANVGRCACRLVQMGRTRRLPSSLTVPAEATAEALPEAVLQVKTVQAAVRSGALKVTVERARKRSAPQASKPARKKQKEGEK